MSTRLKNVRVWNGIDCWQEGISFDAGVIVTEGGVTDIDCGGRVLTPGLVDAHVHLVMGGQSRLGVDLSAVASQAQFTQRLLQEHRVLPADRWVMAHGWNERSWGSTTPPDMTLLEALGDRPTVCWRCDQHAALVNQAVLDRLELPADAPSHRTGLLVEEEAWEVLVPAIPQWPLEDTHRGLHEAVQWLNSMGVTAVRTMEYRDVLEGVLDPEAASLSLRTVVTLLDRTLPLKLDWLAGRSPERPQVIGCKAFFDGTLGSRTARVFEPFIDRGASGRWVECAADDTDQLWCEAVVHAGLAPSIHAIGDAAVRRAADVLAGVPETLRPTIEHAELVRGVDLDDISRLRLSVQPVHRAEDARFAADILGERRAASVLPLRDLLASGARLAFGTDWPITSADPMRTLAAAITGNDEDGRPFHPEQAIDGQDAMHAMTLAAAEAVFLPTAEGLVPGAPADFVVWDRDPFAWDGSGSPPRPAAVFIDGRCVHGELGH